MAPDEVATLPTAYDTLQVGIALYDPETGGILDANERLESILGYTIDELRDRSIAAYTANTYSYSESEFKQRLRASATDGPQQFTWRIKRADGELIWVQIDLAPRTDRRCVRAEVREITDYYDAYHRAELFWRILRHNLRNEATVIEWNAGKIARNARTGVAAEAGETIQSHVDNIGSIAESVKEIERAVTQPKQRVRRSVTRAVRTVVDEVSAAHPAATVTVDERERMWVDVDDAFTHALTHALENAIIHSEESAPSVTVTVGPSPNTGRVEVQIVDTNPPIPDDEITALSTPADITKTSHGSGVGLFVMKWCIESLGGEIKFERSGPCGNTVYFYLPPKASPGGDR